MVFSRRAEPTGVEPMRKLTMAFVASLGSLAFALPAQAAVVIQQSPSFVMPPEEVQLDIDLAPGDDTLRGTTNQTNTKVVFQSMSDNLVASPQGQARIEPLAPGSSDGLNQLMFSLENGGTFTSAEFNILASVGGSVTITALSLTGAVLASSTNPLTAMVSQNGQNFFGILADSSTPIGKVTIEALGNTQISSIAQFRLGGVTGAVPEPATWALMLIGFGILGAGMRRKRTTIGSRVSFA